MSARVLVVDDDRDELDLAVAALGSLGFQVEVAVGGEDALRAALRDPRPDVVLLDLKMHDLGGLDVLRRLRAAPETRRLPVVLFSCSDAPADLAAAAAAGADRYIRKPIGLEGFEDVARQLRDLLSRFR